MNWTEGNLARHSRGRKGKEVLLRQKEHFAKARSGLLNMNVKISPPSISFFTYAQPSSPTCPRSPKPIPSVSSSSRKRAWENGSCQTSRYFQDATVELSSPASFQNDLIDQQALRQKRQKLLMTGDWVGTNVQKPIQMEFSKPRVSADNPWGGSRSRHHFSKQRLRHLLGIKATDGHNRVPEPVIRISTPITRGQLKVRVGDQERVLGSGNSKSSLGSTTYRDIDFSSHTHIRGPKHHKQQKGHANHRNRLGWVSHGHLISDDRGQSIAQTISPPLHQPAPYRPGFPQLSCVQSSDSDNAASNKARIGLHRSDVPSSQVEDNEAWKEFIVGTGRDRISSDFLASASPNCMGPKEISPGISHHGRSKPVECSDEEQEPLMPLRWEFHDTSPGDQESPELVLANPLQSAHSGNFPSLEISNGEGLTPSAIESSPTILQPEASSLGRSSQSDEDIKQDKAPGLSEDSDEVSLLVLPSSPSSSSKDSVSHCNGLPESRGRQVGNKGNLSAPQQPEQLQSEGSVQPSRAFDQTFNAQNEGPPKPCNLEKENDTWREFIMGESEDDLEQAFEEARKETARNLQPSDTSESIDEENASEDVHHQYTGLAEPPVVSDTSFGVGVRDFARHHGDLSSITSTVASVSQKATAGDSSPDPLSEHIPAGLQTQVRSDQATAGSSSRSMSGVSDLVEELAHRSEMWFLTTKEMDNAPLIAHPASTHEHNEADEAFRFARPKPFMGKKTSDMGEQRQIALSLHQIRGKLQTRRRQKRSVDVRPSIRKLPNFSSDPIEEVEEEVPAKRAQKLSLFASLDTEEEK